MKTLVILIAFVVGTLADITYAQVTCVQLGAFTDCSGPGTRGTTQVDLGNGMGVIIGPTATTPYTVLPSTPRASHRATAPTFLYSAPSASPYSYEAPSAPTYELPSAPSAPSYELPSAPSGYGY